MNRQAVRSALARLGVVPRRGLGQNFLVDAAWIERIVEATGVGPDDAVVEIGAGLGGMTLALARRSRAVWAFEIDPRLAAEARRATAAQPHVTVVEGDGAAFAAGIGPCPGPVVVFSSLPYAEWRRILVAAVAAPVPVRSCAFLIQEEVYRKLAGRASALGAVLPAVARLRRLFTVPRRAFHPEPNVRSVLVGVERTCPPPDDFGPSLSALEHLFRWARRKAAGAIDEAAGPTALAAAQPEFGALLERRLHTWPAEEILRLGRFLAARIV